MVKMIEDPKLLAHKRRVDAQRRAAAIARKEAEKVQQQRGNIAAMHKIAKASGQEG